MRFLTYSRLPMTKGGLGANSQSLHRKTGTGKYASTFPHSSVRSYLTTDSSPNSKSPQQTPPHSPTNHNHHFIPENQSNPCKPILGTKPNRLHLISNNTSSSDHLAGKEPKRNFHNHNSVDSELPVGETHPAERHPRENERIHASHDVGDLSHARRAEFGRCVAHGGE